LQASWQNVLEVKDLLQTFYSAVVTLCIILQLKLYSFIPMYRNNMFKFLGQITDFYTMLFADNENILFVNFF